MKLKEITKYVCEICNAEHSTAKAAKECESREVTQDKGVKVGDIILITSGEGIGKKAKVTHRYIIDKNWGHYAWERYWHTVCINVDLLDDSGSGTLTFDSYKLIKKDSAQ